LSIAHLVLFSCPSFIHFLTFSFSSYCSHRDLHSFPTRRSSDLFLKPADWLLPKLWRVTVLIRVVVVEVAAKFLERLNLPILRPRSEEHTSELQSRFDLVCRLLLEKKNRTTRPGPRCQAPGTAWS